MENLQITIEQLEFEKMSLLFHKRTRIETQLV